LPEKTPRPSKKNCAEKKKAVKGGGKGAGRKLFFHDQGKKQKGFIDNFERLGGRALVIGGPTGNYGNSVRGEKQLKRP